MALLTQWTWVWVNSGSWWWTGRPDVLQAMGSQRVGHDWATELNWTKTHVQHRESSSILCGDWDGMLLLLFSCWVMSDPLVTPSTAARQAPLSVGFPRQEHLSQPRDQTWVSCVSCIGRWIFCHWATWEAPDLNGKEIQKRGAVCTRLADSLHWTAGTHTHCKETIFP